MWITTQVLEEAVVVSVHGDLDYSTAASFEQEINQIIATGMMSIIIDGSQLSFIDSAALGRLVAVLRVYRPLGGTMYVVSLKPSIKATLEMIRLDRFLPSFADLPACLAHINKK